ncbi:MAG TPA: uroporphyrinogen-III C-methyltransferase [Pseudomonadales bacterium]|jgi:uroporphyrin-3 C-methyltransferase|nr:uroporphyrinogen-III C-methyltransferase [Pseudomonadales bacterium]HMY95862.1 uroporphyrinogen-III C-methyltransferase [Pseudomonadales bacterium]HMZ71682.1 uroporphyrinogen-III C-methyltransferase [Pseudomonadales bacterium]HNF07639.1 uroporphyrinogen-III C-methyltransferase [Pseudomonadales bacterium]HNH19667.1 uroporphyrinogen-III C-methyltransferase [Pseudomonadales bacterium]
MPKPSLPDSPEPALLGAAQVVQASHTAPAARPVSRWPAWLALGIALLGLLALAALLLWLQPQLSTAWQRLDQLSDASSRLDGRIDGLLQQLEQQGTEQQEQAARLTAQQEQLGQRLDAVTAAQQRFNQGDTPRQWRLAEAEHLLRLANDQLLAGRPLRFARQQLATADRLVAELDDPQLQPLRAALAADLAALDGHAPADVEGQFFRLSAGIGQVDRLPPRGTPSLAEATTGEPAAPVQPGWRGWLDRIWQQLRPLVVIRQRTQSVEPLLTSSQTAMLRQQLQLQLQLAQLALLRGEPSIYHTSLDAALDLLDRQFDGNAAEVTALRATLRELTQQPIATAAPTLEASLSAVRQAIEAERNTPAMTPSPFPAEAP